MDRVAVVSIQGDLHNQLAKRFVHDILGPAIRADADYGDVMVLFESAQLATMHLLRRHYGMSPQVTSGLMEAALQNAIVRFSEGS